jgi:hypothetical protein
MVAAFGAVVRHFALDDAGVGPQAAGEQAAEHLADRLRESFR